MLTQEQSSAVVMESRKLLIISMAMLMGIATLSAVFLAVMMDWEEVNSNFEMLTMLGAGLGAMGLVSLFVLPSIIGAVHMAKIRNDLGSGALEHDSANLLTRVLMAYSARHIVRYGILDGVGILNLVIFAMVEHSWISLGITGGCAFLMLALIPRADSIGAWTDETLTMLKQTSH